jgi:hypothetical protein
MLAYTLSVDGLPVLLPGVSKTKYDTPIEPLVFGVNRVFRARKVLKLLVLRLASATSVVFGVVRVYVALAVRSVNALKR